MFGLFKPPGKIEIQTDKLSYSYGETIKAKVNLTMNEMKKAKGLRLEFYATRQVPYQRTEKDAKGVTRTVTDHKTETVHSFSASLDSEHEYSGSKEYDIELKIPAQQQVKMPDGILGQVAGLAIAAAQISGNLPKQAHWYIKASLDIPMGADCTKQIEIQVS